MTCEPNPITLPILLAIALFAYCWRDLRRERGSVHSVTGETK
jgi:hypothetical protein